jgi:starch synthase (maltosyl-transferring)
MEIALDIAFQCSPDHPYVTEHPEWFVKRPDGTIQYAENPPKKYQDIYPINFETAKAQELWEELRSVMLYWIAQGVHVFRVDNPHTKSFYFWEWAINSIKQQHPETIFLSEAFTRPKVMYNLAKLGFTQSYTYFTWRNSKWELTQYMTELTQTEVREFFRPNFWPNTPDILHAFLQNGGRTAFKIRLVLAATMTANYGLYGPAFELCVNVPREPGSEEYLDSEKYQLRHWNLDHPDSLRDLMTRVNWIRRDNPALQSDWSIRFHPTDNEQIICYSKRTPDYSNRILVVASFDPVHTQAGWVGVDLNELGIDPNRPYMVHDLLSGATYTWQTWSWNYVELRPHDIAAHVFRIEQP